jgi:ribosome-associated heat shock protein Hsp15
MAEAFVKVRLDKWLWAARFFKTRALAKAAIEGGKVHYNGARVKVSKEVAVGNSLKIRQGMDEKIIEIIALSDKRRGAAEAQALYSETEASVEARERHQLLRKQQQIITPDHKPSKKERRKIQDFKQQHYE